MQPARAARGAPPIPSRTEAARHSWGPSPSCARPPYQTISAPAPSRSSARGPWPGKTNRTRSRRRKARLNAWQRRWLRSSGERDTRPAPGCSIARRFSRSLLRICARARVLLRNRAGRSGARTSFQARPLSKASQSGRSRIISRYSAISTSTFPEVCQKLVDVIERTGVTGAGGMPRGTRRRHPRAFFDQAAHRPGTCVQCRTWGRSGPQCEVRRSLL